MKISHQGLLVAASCCMTLGLTACQDPNFTGNPFAPSKATQASLPKEMVLQRVARQNSAKDQMAQQDGKVILFGDTHVHSTYSLDAFQWSLPIMHGAEGAFPPADACDYARFVSQLDFYFLTDHAESYSPQKWADQVDSIRQCAQMTDAENPDVIPFIGWEWTQVGYNADDHYGHHNVLFKDIEEGKIPSRSIAAEGPSTIALRGDQGKVSKLIYLIDPVNANMYSALNDFNAELQATPICEKGVPSNELPAACFESAANPGQLYKKLDDWGFDTLVIPHGTTWGNYTPPNASWAHQLTKKYHDDDKNRLVEVYSGHGSSEQYRDWETRVKNDDGSFTCPAPQDNYLPSCWQAGVIIEKRCLDQGIDTIECDKRAAQARQDYANHDTVAAWWSVPGTEVGDWLDSGQARDIVTPAFNYRPKKSVQYGLALRNFDDENNPLRYTWGMIGSTDTHSARAGHGFKQTPRKTTSDENGLKSSLLNSLLAKDKGDRSEAFSHDVGDPAKLMAKVGYSIMENERLQSFFTLGGIAAVHADSRSRDGIWNALKRKETYATTGHRMLLWFNLLNEKSGKHAMGSQVNMKKSPKFEVKAVASFKQQDGCPEKIFESMPKARAQKLSSGECYYPSDERYNLDRIEIVRITPQNHQGEDVAPLIQDPWMSFQCPENSSSCDVTFEDKDFTQGKRDAVYYARVYEETLPTVNGGNLRTTFDKDGNAIKVNPCYGDYRTEISDNCQVDVPQRAWSSPIFVDYQ